MWRRIRAERAAGAGVREPPLAWPTAVEAVLDGLAARHGEHLVVIEGAARGGSCGPPVVSASWSAGGPPSVSPGGLAR
jgi:hypothetical protein